MLFWAGLLASPITEEQIEITDKVEYMAEIYGQDPHLALRIIWCESRMNPEAVNLNRTKDGEVWSKDLGLLQINDYFHEREAKRRGYDINLPEHNLEYGFVLMEEQGTLPWSASRKCWS